MRAILLAALILGLSTPALAQSWADEISSFDRDRLGQLGDAKAKGMAEAERGASPGDFATVRAVAGPDGAGVSEGAIKGSWRCRTIKTGGMAPAVIYSWFRCRIRDTRNGLYFEKLTGTQRISGYLDRYNDGFLLLGSMTVGKRAPPALFRRQSRLWAPSPRTATRWAC